MADIYIEIGSVVQVEHYNIYMIKALHYVIGQYL